MTTWTLENGRVTVSVSSDGFVYPAEFHLPTGTVSPLHRAPWLEEPGHDDLPPMLRGLRGDFFCAPFGDSDVLPDEQRPHGRTANGAWQPEGHSSQHLALRLEGTVSGAGVTKRVHLRPGHVVVYQEHVFTGGSGTLPVGHHLMLHAVEPLLLGFSPWVWGGTPPAPVEPDPTRGRSLLRYPQRFDTLEAVQLEDGCSADLTVYPSLERHEDLLLLAADPSLPFAWSAVTSPTGGWVWFALKDPRVLHSTVLWLSNGGRDYPPFSGRHQGVIGIEEVTAFFHLGHRASLDPNVLRGAGIPTALELSTGNSIRYLFGVVAAPPGFGQVHGVTAAPGGVRLEDAAGLEVYAPCDPTFVQTPLTAQGDA